MKGFKQNTTRVTLLVGGNAAGEKLKPFMIGSSQMPHSLRGINRGNLNCYYHASKKSWMNSNLFGNGLWIVLFMKWKNDMEMIF